MHSVRVFPIRRSGQNAGADRDVLAVEEPLEIRVQCGAGASRPISITMRTPGEDLELAAGFLRSECILCERGELLTLEHAQQVDDQKECNTVEVGLTDAAAPRLERIERHFYATSSCGVCGKASLEALELQGCRRCQPDQPRVSADLLRSLPAKLRAAQQVFERTGGLHAAALFASDGTLICLREDVGRHNAVDKVIGRQFLDDALPLSDCILLVSGRASFEIVQKAVAAGVPIVAAIGAPSSLAVELAREYGQTLAGFLSAQRFNIYCGEGRLTNR